MGTFNEGYTKTDINYVARDEVENELGVAELKRLTELHQWLLHGPANGTFQVGSTSFADLTDEQISFRSAPSIIVRSEAELFGINMPRFAFRALLAEDKKAFGFVNLRRIESFVKAVGRRLEIRQNQSFLRLLHSNCRCIGDSFLKVPEWIKSRYRVITTQLERWYGEQEIGCGTIFVTHFPIGGGMCAQAACFMASALLHDHAKGVFGVAEITMLASPNPQEQRFLKFSGLTPDDLARYFRHPSVGLNAMVQNASNESEFKSSLEAYVLSNCPVVLPVDMRCFKDRIRSGEDRPPLYERLGLGGQSLSARSELHAVLVVGVRRPGSEAGMDFIIHDPATLPYAEVTAKELFEAACIIPGQPAKFIPVTPAETKIPLRDVVISHHRDFPYLPSEKIAKAIHRQVSDGASMKHIIPGMSTFVSTSEEFVSNRDWRLVALDFSEKTHRPSLVSPRKWADLTRLFRGLPHSKGRMAWIGVEQNGERQVVRIFPSTNAKWNGETILGPHDNQLEEFYFFSNTEVDEWQCNLIPTAITTWMSQAWVIEERGAAYLETASCCSASECPIRPLQTATSPSPRLPLSSHSEELQLSLISSFTTQSRDVAQRLWGQLNGTPAAEQYLWFQQDIQMTLEMFVANSRAIELTAVDAMATIKHDGALSKILVNKHVEGVWENTTALASFIPEISADPESRRARVARQAIRFLGRLAIAMQKRLNSSKSRVVENPLGLRIELVAGSLIDTVFHNFSGGDQRPELVGSLLSRQETHRNIADNLHRALTEEEALGPGRADNPSSDLCAELSRHGICFAMEQEPGPIFSLGSRESVVEFCSYLERHQVDEAGRNRFLAWKQLVGLNVDIAHWAMSEIDLGAVPPAVQMRIAHSHISGHHEHAHFGDTWLGDDHELRFKNAISWLTYANGSESRAVRTSQNYPQFSGCVSVEFEAARCLNDVNKSLDQAAKMLAAPLTESC